MSTHHCSQAPVFRFPEAEAGAFASHKAETERQWSRTRCNPHTTATKFNTSADLNAAISAHFQGKQLTLKLCREMADIIGDTLPKQASVSPC